MHGTLDLSPSPARMSELACTHRSPHETRRSLRLGRRQRLFRRTPRRRWRCGLGDLRQAGHCPVRPGVAALAGMAAPEAFWQLCRDELLGVDVATDGWDIRARWFGVVICATPRLGAFDRGITIPWRVIAAQITAQQRRGC